MNDFLGILGEAVSRAVTTLNDAYPGLPWILASLFAAAIIWSTAAAVRCNFTTQRGTPCTKGSFGVTCHHHRPYATFGPKASTAGVRGALAAVAAAPAVGLGLGPLL